MGSALGRSTLAADDACLVSTCKEAETGAPQSPAEFQQHRHSSAAWKDRFAREDLLCLSWFCWRSCRMRELVKCHRDRA